MLHFAWDVECQPFAELTSIKLLYELAGLKGATPLGEFFFYDEWRFCQHYVFNLVMFLRFFLEYELRRVFFRASSLYSTFLLISGLLNVGVLSKCKNHIDRGITFKISCFFNFLLPIQLSFLNLIKFKCKKS